MSNEHAMPWNGANEDKGEGRPVVTATDVLIRALFETDYGNQFLEMLEREAKVALIVTEAGELAMANAQRLSARSVIMRPGLLWPATAPATVEPADIGLALVL